MSTDWTDRIAGARMTVDNEFNSRIAQSEFSNQEWGMIMTAVEFEIEDPEDPDAARIVADTSKVPQIMPALDEVQSGMSAMGGAPSGSGGGGGGGGGGIIDSVKDALGLGGGGGGSDPRIAAADELAQEYAGELQSQLESTGQWSEIRAIAAKSEE